MRKPAACLLMTIVVLLQAWCSHAHQETLGQSIKNCSFPLAGTLPSASDSDLAFLRHVLAATDIVALGEATHGTKEFFTMKHRIVKYLVEHMGYKVFAMEANFSECTIINEYVMHGRGNPVAALKGVYFWTWNTEEVLDMVVWMRQYNTGKADADKVQFWGMDMQYGRGAAEVLLAATKPHNIHGGIYEALLDTISRHKNTIAEIDSAQRKQLIELYRELEMSAALRNQYAREEYELLLQHGKTLLQAAEYRLRNEGYRDSCMAENVKWLHGHTGEKIIVWAHNTHIARMPVGTPNKPMGQWLLEYNKSYYAVGFDFGTGSFRAYKAKYATGNARDFVQPVSIDKIKKGTTSYSFHQGGLPQFFVNFKQLTINGICSQHVASRFQNEYKMKVIGAIYWPKWEKDYYHKVKLSEAFDGVIYIDRTSAATPINSFFDR